MENCGTLRNCQVVTNKVKTRSVTSGTITITENLTAPQASITNLTTTPQVYLNVLTENVAISTEGPLPFPITKENKGFDVLGPTQWRIQEDGLYLVSLTLNVAEGEAEAYFGIRLNGTLTDPRSRIRLQGPTLNVSTVGLMRLVTGDVLSVLYEVIAGLAPFRLWNHGSLTITKL